MSNLKPWLQMADVRASEVSPKNPYGFFHPSRRLDTADGVDRFLGEMMAPAAAHGVEGVIIWAWYHAIRGGMYRPDSHILPPEIEANLPRLMRGLEKLGMKAGVCIRPQHLIANCGTYDVAVRGSYDKHNTGLADYAAHVTRTWVDRGVRHFYADSFGESPWHVPILNSILGVGAKKVWMEASCNATLAAGGSIYCEHPRMGPWNTPEDVTAARINHPNVDILCAPRQWKLDGGSVQTGYVDIVKMGRRPLMWDYQFSAGAIGKSDAVAACELIRRMAKQQEVNEIKRDKGAVK